MTNDEIQMIKEFQTLNSQRESPAPSALFGHWSLIILFLLLATQFLAAAQNGFTDAEAGAIQAFLRENFGNTNAGMVIGLVDERGSRVLAACKLDNGTPQEVKWRHCF